jgi:hypothetical protein
MGPLPPRDLAARFFAAVIRPPLLFFIFNALLFGALPNTAKCEGDNPFCPSIQFTRQARSYNVKVLMLSSSESFAVNLNLIFHHNIHALALPISFD